MISKKYYTLVFAVLTSILMSTIMSGFVTYLNLGMPEDFASKWFHAGKAAFALALPVSLFVIPFVKKLTDKITD